MTKNNTKDTVSTTSARNVRRSSGRGHAVAARCPWTVCLEGFLLLLCCCVSQRSKIIVHTSISSSFPFHVHFIGRRKFVHFLLVWASSRRHNKSTPTPKTKNGNTCCYPKGVFSSIIHMIGGYTAIIFYYILLDTGQVLHNISFVPSYPTRGRRLITCMHDNVCLACSFVALRLYALRSIREALRLC